MDTLGVFDFSYGLLDMLGLVWFEIDLCWAPSLDRRASFVRMRLV